MRIGLIAATVIVAGLFAHGGHAEQIEELDIVARVGPWPIASKLIGYRGRVWFVNSVLGRNHNSADIYSYQPSTRSVRYERHLFSQDSGDPVTAFGLLYWPSEDSRWSIGWGDFRVTNGEAWAGGTIPTAQIFHIHAMTALDGRLIAASSAWRGGIQISDDRGATWRELYDHATPPRRVSRIISLASTSQRAYGYLLDRGERRLLAIDRDRVTEVPGWPQDRPIYGMAGIGHWLYALVRETSGVAIWRTDGVTSALVAPVRENWDALDLVAADGKLWALSEHAGGGAVWTSLDGADWQKCATLTGGSPYDLAVVDGMAFVGGSAGGQGIVWGPTRSISPRSLPAPVDLPDLLPASPAGFADAAQRFSTALLRLESYRERAMLTELAFELARARPPPATYRDLRALDFPTDEISLIGGRVKIPAATLGRWLVLWSMSLAGMGPVPPEWINEPWSTPANPSEKYFASQPGAMRAAALASQRDRDTLNALIEVLASEQTPRWLRGDAVGALTALTGQRLGYDAAAWRAAIAR